MRAWGGGVARGVLYRLLGIVVVVVVVVISDVSYLPVVVETPRTTNMSNLILAMIA